MPLQLNVSCTDYVDYVRGPHQEDTVAFEFCSVSAVDVWNVSLMRSDAFPTARRLETLPGRSR